MNSINRRCVHIGVLLLVGVMMLLPVRASAQTFDFERLTDKVEEFTVVVNLKVELSFGTHQNEQEQRLLGTIVSEDGLVIFDGSFLAQDNMFSAMAGMDIKTTPTKIEVKTFDERTYEAEYLGVDRFTRLAFARITDSDDTEFKPVRFTNNHRFQVGSWVALYMLLPEFVSPPLGGDVGMISAIIESPEHTPLTVGFSNMEVASVLFDERLNAVGVLGPVMDPSSATADASGLIDGFGEFDIPLLGIITGERMAEMIADPPQKGKIDRAWLGITLQALTEDIGDFLDIEAEGGIIVNDVMAGSPADEAGLMVGDVITGINGQSIDVDREERLSIFQRRIAEMGPGATVEFTVVRPGEDQNEALTLLAELDKAPISPSEAEDFESDSLEFTVRNMVFADYLRLNQQEEDFGGVVVSEMKRGGLAMLGGLQIGDVIQRVGNNPVSSVTEFEQVLSETLAANPEEVIFFIWRDNKTMFVNVKTE